MYKQEIIKIVTKQVKLILKIVTPQVTREIVHAM